MESFHSIHYVSKCLFVRKKKKKNYIPSLQCNFRTKKSFTRRTIYIISRDDPRHIIHNRNILKWSIDDHQDTSRRESISLVCEIGIFSIDYLIVISPNLWTFYERGGRVQTGTNGLFRFVNRDPREFRSQTLFVPFPRQSRYSPLFSPLRIFCIFRRDRTLKPTFSLIRYSRWRRNNYTVRRVFIMSLRKWFAFRYKVITTSYNDESVRYISGARDFLREIIQGFGFTSYLTTCDPTRTFSCTRFKDFSLSWISDGIVKILFTYQ